MSDAKTLFQSRTIWAALLALVGGALGLAGYSFSEADQASALELISGVVAAIGGLGALFGRIAANKKIGLKAARQR